MRNFLFIVISVISLAGYANLSSIGKMGLKEGLSNEFVVAITQDKDGFLWFATEEGLNKFDGTRFTSYYKHTSSISANELNYIHADPVEPVIWIATQRAGLNAFNYEQNKLQVYVHHPDSPTSVMTNDITAIAPAADGNLWVSTYHWGVEYFNKETQEFIHYNTTTLPGLVSNSVWSILDDGEGSLYVGHVMNGMSVLSIKEKRVKNFKNNPADPGSIPGNEVRCIYQDSNNNIWVGTNKGVALFNAETESFITLGSTHGDVLSSYIYHITQTDDNKLWIATELNGVAIVDLRHHLFLSTESLAIQQYTLGYNKYSLSNPSVRCVFQDSFKNIWLGTYGGGVNFIGSSPALFDTYGFSPIPDDKSSLTNRVALSLCADKDNRLWIGTDGGGVNVFEKGKRVAVYNKENGWLSHNTIQAAFRDSGDNIWLGAFWGGVYFFDSRRKQFQRIELGGTLEQNVRCFFEDRDKNIWVGTDLGVFVLDPDTRSVIQHFHTRTHRLPENFVRAIGQDSYDRIWMGSFGQGLAVYTRDMQLIESFEEYNGFCSNTINGILKDSQGQVWVATGEGLVCFDSADTLNYRVFKREDGLSNTYIRAVAEDEKGNIWFSTNTGISCYLKGLNEIRNYNSFNKVPMGSFTNNAVTSAGNSIYFGSTSGVRYFDPAAVLIDREVPPVVITKMEAYGTKESSGIHLDYLNDENRSVKLNYKQNTFTIAFNIQDYSLAGQVDYSYRLKGLDDSWHTTEENSTTFRNIPPGFYRFQVRTRLQNQAWAEAVTVLPIHITPPLWLTWWARGCYLLMAGFLVFYLLHAYKKRVDLQGSYELEKKNREQEQDLNNERLRFYTNIAHELRTPLTLILGPLEDLQRDTQLLPKQTQKISVVRQSALRLLNLINQILEFRKTETQNKKLCVSKDNMATLVKETGLKYKELNRNPGIHFAIEVEEEQMWLYYDKEIITIALDNLLSNAIKYTDKGQITLSLYTVVKEGVSYTEIKVEDTGSGIPPEEQAHIFDRYYQAKSERQVSGTGIGLALVKNLITLHEGEIRVESELGKGSRFIFSLLTHNIYTNALHGDKEEKKEEEENESVEEQFSGDKPILLVVEDNVDIRTYISESFADSFEVFIAGEGNEGYKIALEHIPDVIVSDIMMPGMNGIEFCKVIKEDVNTSHIPVILLTAKDTLQDKEEGYISGADSYLTKPFSATLLRSRINNLLEARRKLAGQINMNTGLEGKSLAFKESLSKLDSEFLENITQLIENNIESERVNITYLSDKLCMSSSTLFRKVKALTGMSTNELIRKIKMKNAEKLLLTGKFNISEVAFKVGINSPVYFRQCFREEFGVSPSEYLKKLNS